MQKAEASFVGLCTRVSDARKRFKGNISRPKSRSLSPLCSCDVTKEYHTPHHATDPHQNFRAIFLAEKVLQLPAPTRITNSIPFLTLPTKDRQAPPFVHSFTWLSFVYQKMVLSFILVQNRQGKTRLAKWYAPYTDEEKVKLKGEVLNSMFFHLLAQEFRLIIS